jgi:SAM-dependent methyltransferase
VTDPDRINFDVPLSQLPSPEKDRRSASFGGVASQYERYRPGPHAAAVDWMLPNRLHSVVDLGAGTGALTRLLMDRADQVIAVEPDDRMRSILIEEIPGARAVMGKGESMPIPDGCADAVVASTSWHWMDPVPTLSEVHRVLQPNGILGVLWSGPDPEGAFLAQAQTLLSQRPAEGSDGGLGGLIMGDARRPASTLEIPPTAPFEQPEHQVFRWDVALDADELIGLLGTFSWIITMPDETRNRVIAEARRLLRELLGVEGEVTVDVTFRSDAWRSRAKG